MNTVAMYQPLVSDVGSASGEFMNALQVSWEVHAADASWQQVVDGCWDSFISSLLQLEAAADAARTLSTLAWQPGPPNRPR